MVLTYAYQGQTIAKHSSSTLSGSRSLSPFGRGSAQRDFNRSTPNLERVHHESVFVPGVVPVVHKTQAGMAMYMGRVSSSTTRRNPPRRHRTMLVAAPPRGSTVTTEPDTKTSSRLSVPPPLWNSNGCPELKPTVHHGTQKVATCPVVVPMSEHLHSGPFNVAALSTGPLSKGQADAQIQGDRSTIVEKSSSPEMNYYQDPSLLQTPKQLGAKMRCGATTEDANEKQTPPSVSQPKAGHPHPSSRCCDESVATPPKPTRRRIQETSCFESPCSIFQPTRNGFANPVCGVTHALRSDLSSPRVTETQEGEFRHSHDQGSFENGDADDDDTVLQLSSDIEKLKTPHVSALMLEAPLEPPMPRWHRCDQVLEVASADDAAVFVNDERRRCRISCNRAYSDTIIPDIVAPPLLGGGSTTYSRFDGGEHSYRTPPHASALLVEPAIESNRFRPSNRAASTTPLLPSPPPSLGAMTKVTNFGISNDSPTVQHSADISRCSASRGPCSTCERCSTIVAPLSKAAVDAETQTDICHFASELLHGGDASLEASKAYPSKPSPCSSCGAQISRSVERVPVWKGDRSRLDSDPLAAPLTKTVVAMDKLRHERHVVCSENLETMPIKRELATGVQSDNLVQAAPFAESLFALPTESPRRERCRSSTALSVIALDARDVLSSRDLPISVSNSPVNSSFGWTPPSSRFENCLNGHNQNEISDRQNLICLEVKGGADSAGNALEERTAKQATYSNMFDSPVSKFPKQVSGRGWEGMISNRNPQDIASKFRNKMGASNDGGSLTMPFLGESSYPQSLNAVSNAADAAAADAAREVVLDGCHADVNHIAEADDKSNKIASTSSWFEAFDFATAKDIAAMGELAKRTSHPPAADVGEDVMAKRDGASRDSSPKVLSPSLTISTGCDVADSFDTSCVTGYPPLHALRQRASALSRRLQEREQQCLELKNALEGCGLRLPGSQNLRTAGISSYCDEEATKSPLPGTRITNISHVEANLCNLNSTPRKPVATCDNQLRDLSPPATAATQM